MKTSIPESYEYNCDHCKKIIPESEISSDGVVEFKTSEGEPRKVKRFDLCINCAGKLIDFLDGKP